MRPLAVSANGYENTIMIEFENDSASKIKTIRMWVGGDTTFKSFKTEHDWSGGKYSDSKLLIFTATSTLNPGESVKFGLTTNEKVNGVNWIAMDQNGKEIDTRKTNIAEISKTISSYAEGEGESVGKVKETGSSLYGTKKFIPEILRPDSDIRLIGSGFGFEKNLQLFLDATLLKSVKTDNVGNFLTTISIPGSTSVGTNEFLIKDESGNFQSTNINIKEPQNRFLKSAQFAVNDVPPEVGYDETLTISGNAYPQSAIIVKFEDMERVLEKIRVITANSNGEWIFEEPIDRTDNIGEKYVILENGHNKIVNTVMIKTGDTLNISTIEKRYNQGDTVSVSGTSEPNKNTTIWVKDDNKKTLLYTIITTDGNGDFNWEFDAGVKFPTGTYTVIAKQESGSDATLFGINQYPSLGVVVLVDQKNFMINSKAALNIVGPESSRLSITILDSSDTVKITDHVTTSSLGRGKYVMDLNTLPTGIYRAVASIQNIQDSVKFSIGIETGAGVITLSTIHDRYSPGESILILGNAAADVRLTIALHDPFENLITKTEIFTDGTGGFSTYDIGIPSDGIPGDWILTAYSPGSVTQTKKTISIVDELVDGLTLELEATEFNIGDDIIIKGTGRVDIPQLTIQIINQGDQVIIELRTPIVEEELFETTWKIPTEFNVGVYTIEISDKNRMIYDSVEITIQ